MNYNDEDDRCDYFEWVSEERAERFKECFENQTQDHGLGPWLNRRIKEGTATLEDLLREVCDVWLEDLDPERTHAARAAAWKLAMAAPEGGEERASLSQLAYRLGIDELGGYIAELPALVPLALPEMDIVCHIQTPGVGRSDPAYVSAYREIEQRVADSCVGGELIPGTFCRLRIPRGAVNDTLRKILAIPGVRVMTVERHVTFDGLDWHGPELFDLTGTDQQVADLRKWLAIDTETARRVECVASFDQTRALLWLGWEAEENGDPRTMFKIVPRKEEVTA